VTLILLEPFRKMFRYIRCLFVNNKPEKVSEKWLSQYYRDTSNEDHLWP